jgi:hypothetical protein
MTEMTPIDPARVSADQLAKLLSNVSRSRIEVDAIHRDLESGAPRNSDGTLNLVHYAPWLVREERQARENRS